MHRGIMALMRRMRAIFKPFPKRVLSVLPQILLITSLLLAAVGCNDTNEPSLAEPTPIGKQNNIILSPLPNNTATPTLLPSATAPPTPFVSQYNPAITPTPDAAKPIRDRGAITITYAIQRGDTLSGISAQFDVSEDDLRSVNNLTVRQANRLRAGDTIYVPVPVEDHGPSLKLIPNSELVNGPTAIDFDIAGFISQHDGYLKTYSEKVDGDLLPASQIVQRVANQFSVHPRLLLAALEFTGGWITNPDPRDDALLYPLGFKRTNQQSLFIQLNWAASRLNEGYYGWRLDNRYIVRFDDGQYAFVGNGINAGTAGLQNYLAAIGTKTIWLDLMGDGERSFLQTYKRLFGNPWQFDIGELVPVSVRQPELGLPFGKGELWYFTGGPHSAWARGTPWGALDFASANVQGCDDLPSDWVQAMTEGRIVRSVHGEVAQSLDPRQDERAGWSVLYMHVGAEERVQVGQWLRRGERIGHPSCEGGVAAAAHVHVARKYNGEWLDASGIIPFVLSGWSVTGSTQEYDGYLTNGDKRREACDCKNAMKNGVSW